MVPIDALPPVRLTASVENYDTVHVADFDAVVPEIANHKEVRLYVDGGDHVKAGRGGVEGGEEGEQESEDLHYGDEK
jgi:hypothetical protein